MREPDGKFKPYRCSETIDLEEMIAMKTEGKFTMVKAIVTYQSGRTETIHGKLNKDNIPDKVFQKKISDLRQFPSVTNIETIKY